MVESENEIEVEISPKTLAEASIKDSSNRVVQVRRQMLEQGRQNLFNDPDTKNKNLHIQQIIDEEFKEDRLMTINEVADILGVSQQTIRNWEGKGKLIPIRTEGNHRRYKESDINSLRKQSMAAQQIIINGTTSLQMEGLFHSLFGAFDPLEKINVTVINDTINGTLKVSVESNDESTQTSRSFEIN